MTVFKGEKSERIDFMRDWQGEILKKKPESICTSYVFLISYSVTQMWL